MPVDAIPTIAAPATPVASEAALNVVNSHPRTGDQQKFAQVLRKPSENITSPSREPSRTRDSSPTKSGNQVRDVHSSRETERSNEPSAAAAADNNVTAESGADADHASEQTGDEVPEVELVTQADGEDVDSNVDPLTADEIAIEAALLVGPTVPVPLPEAKLVASGDKLISQSATNAAGVSEVKITTAAKFVGPHPSQEKLAELAAQQQLAAAAAAVDPVGSDVTAVDALAVQPVDVTGTISAVANPTTNDTLSEPSAADVPSSLTTTVVLSQVSEPAVAASNPQSASPTDDSQDPTAEFTHDTMPVADKVSNVRPVVQATAQNSRQEQGARHPEEQTDPEPPAATPANIAENGEMLPTDEDRQDSNKEPAEANAVSQQPVVTDTNSLVSASADQPTVQPTHNYRLPPHVAAAESAPQSRSTVPDVDANRFLQRVARAFQAADERGGEVRLRLSPPELGALRLEVTVREGVLTARVETETSSARTILLDNLPQLRERLAEQGMKIEKFDVDVSGRQSGQMPDTQQQAEEQNRQRAVRQASLRPVVNESTPRGGRPGPDSQGLNVLI